MFFMKLVICIKYQFVKAEKICVTVYRLSDSLWSRSRVWWCQEQLTAKPAGSLEQVVMYHKIDTRVEAGSNTSTVTLRVLRGDEIGLKKAAP
jgi:hypothetical protein